MTLKEFDNRIASLESKLDIVVERFDKIIGLLSGAVSVTAAATMPQPDCVYSFGDWLTKWYETYKKPKLKSSTLYSMELSIKHLLNAPLSMVDITKLDGLEIQDYLTTIEKGNTRKKINQIITACLDKALKLRKIMYNPALSVELPSYRTTHYRPLEYDEQNKLIYYYENPTEYYNYNSLAPRYFALFRFLCCTGLRIGEFLALDFKKDIDQNAKLITVNKSLDSRTGNIDTPKTKTSVRQVPFLPDLLPLIRTLAKSKFTYNAVRLHFERIYKTLGIKEANIHTFRHTFVSLCYASGMSAKRIQTIVGHAEINTTLNIYTHILKAGTSPIYDYIKRLKKEIEPPTN